MADLEKWRLWRRLRRLLQQKRKPGDILRFAGYTLRRFLRDGGPSAASSLSYATLLALVPLIAICFAVLSAFPVFDTVEEQIQALILRSFLPETGVAVSEHLGRLVENARAMTAPGVVALAITSLLLLGNINVSLNAIWRTREHQPFGLRFLVYWALLTLGPLLVGASLSLSGIAFAKMQLLGLETEAFALADMISIGLAALGFSLLYYLAPNRPISLAHALTGGLVAAVIFEGLKYGFGLYLESFPSYQAIYGALSAIPIFLVWMYLSWAVVLFGAEVTAALPEWRAAIARGDTPLNAGHRLALALALLGRLRAGQKAGRQLGLRKLGQGLPATPAELDETLGHLQRNGAIERSQKGRWLLARDLNEVTLRDLAVWLGLGLEPGEGWPEEARVSVAAVAKAAGASLDVPVEGLLLDDPEVPSIAQIESLRG